MYKTPPADTNKKKKNAGTVPPPPPPPTHTHTQTHYHHHHYQLLKSFFFPGTLICIAQRLHAPFFFRILSSPSYHHSWKAYQWTSLYPCLWRHTLIVLLSISLSHYYQLDIALDHQCNINNVVSMLPNSLVFSWRKKSVDQKNYDNKMCVYSL